MIDRDLPITPNWPRYLARVISLPTPDQTSEFLTHFEGRESLHLLDFGCGNGQWGAAFHRDREAHHIGPITVDVADKHLDQARHISPDWTGKQFHDDFTNIPLEPNHYDGIMSRYSIMFQPIEAFQSSLNNCANALKTGGIIYFTVARHTGAARDKNITRMSREEIAQSLTTAGLKPLSVTLDKTATIGPDHRKISTYHIYATK